MRKKTEIDFDSIFSGKRKSVSSSSKPEVVPDSRYFGGLRLKSGIGMGSKFHVRHVLGNDDNDQEPSVDNFNFSFGNFQLVGHGEKTNDYCGQFRGFHGCVRTELHGKNRLDGKNFKGKVFVRKVFFSCDRPACPVCFKYGWASRQAHTIEVRLAEASKHFGQVEHIVATVPPKFYGLSLEDLRLKIYQILKRRNIIGGAVIFHGARFNELKSWYWSPHFHVLGVILGGYGKCRNCQKKCFKGCGGWEDLKYRAYEKDGCIVRVLGKRKTVGGTAWYQLHHSTIDVTKKRFRVTTWFGVVSYRKLKVTPELRKKLCPVCLHDCFWLGYSGKKALVLDKDSPDFRRKSFEDLKENGIVVWAERGEG